MSYEDDSKCVLKLIDEQFSRTLNEVHRTFFRKNILANRDILDLDPRIHGDRAVSVIKKTLFDDFILSEPRLRKIEAVFFSRTDVKIL